eukprot:scaffold14203_cov47-Prasinocladus_malaysianus.AAC.5
MEPLTREVTDLALEIHASTPQVAVRTDQDICNLAYLVQDPTQTSTSTGRAALEMLVGALEQFSADPLTTKAANCAANMLSHLVALADSSCTNPDVSRSQGLMNKVREAVSLLGQKIANQLRAGMPSVILDTMQLTIEVKMHIPLE